MLHKSCFFIQIGTLGSNHLQSIAGFHFPVALSFSKANRIFMRKRSIHFTVVFIFLAASFFYLPSGAKACSGLSAGKKSVAVAQDTTESGAETMVLAGGRSGSGHATPEQDAADPPDEENDASPWEVSWRSSLTGSQASYRSWSQGGTDNLSVLAASAYSSSYKKEQFGFSQSVNLRYGQSRVGDGEFVKSDDLVRVRNQVSWLLRDERFGFIFNLNFETQFDTGYDIPVPEEGEKQKVISRFLAPAFVNEVMGMTYRPDSHFRLEAGLAMKQTIVRDTGLSGRYGLDEGSRFRNEAGFSLFAGYERRLMENIHYAGYVETFTNVNKSIRSSDLLFVNEITGQINRYIGANVEFALAYNDDITNELQVRQSISIGLNYNFFAD